MISALFAGSERSGTFQCSSASRKFLNAGGAHRCAHRNGVGFSALQRAENSSIGHAGIAPDAELLFQCSSASRKFLNRREHQNLRTCVRVSVLFSEPKIPQFSASGRARYSAPEFQCSSASRKFLNSFSSQNLRTHVRVSVLFSEPKIPQWDQKRSGKRGARVFQCSSASRKFLNAQALFALRRQTTTVSVLFSEPKIPQFSSAPNAPRWASGFSALQRAENSSIARDNRDVAAVYTVSVLFSEPKIPQSLGEEFQRVVFRRVSVLFSEPKIPQCTCVGLPDFDIDKFQCSSASRKFLNVSGAHPVRGAHPRFQCSSASRKFLNPDPRTCVHPYSRLRRSRFVVPEPSWCVAMTPVY